MQHNWVLKEAVYQSRMQDSQNKAKQDAGRVEESFTIPATHPGCVRAPNAGVLCSMLMWGENVIKLLIFWRIVVCRCWEIGQWARPAGSDRKQWVQEFWHASKAKSVPIDPPYQIKTAKITEKMNTRRVGDKKNLFCALQLLFLFTATIHGGNFFE